MNLKTISEGNFDLHNEVRPILNLAVDMVMWLEDRGWVKGLHRAKEA